MQRQRAAALLPLLLVAGCSKAGTATSGPLRDTGDPTFHVCTWDPHQQTQLQMETVLDHEHETYRFTGASLVGAKNLRLVATFLIPQPGLSGFGNGMTYPPPPHANFHRADLNWSQREQFGDGSTAVLSPTRYRSWEVVIAVRRSKASEPGSFTHVAVDYATGNAHDRAVLQPSGSLNPRGC